MNDTMNVQLSDRMPWASASASAAGRTGTAASFTSLSTSAATYTITTNNLIVRFKPTINLFHYLKKLDYSRTTEQKQTDSITHLFPIVSQKFLITNV